ncbi:MAG: ATP-binding protein [Candidatus Rokuibacteriota bacterium]
MVKSPLPIRPAVAGYVLGVVLPAAALALVLVAGQLLERHPSLPFMLAVLVAAWLGGLGPGLLATTVSVLSLLFLVPHHSLVVPVREVPWLLLFVTVAVAVAWLGAASSRAKGDVRAGEQRLQVLARLAPVGLFRTDAAGQYRYVNERWCELTGLSPEQARDAGWTTALHPEDRDRILALRATAIREGREFRDECRFLAPDGTTRWVEARALPEWGSGGQIVSYIGTVTEITERRRAEAERAVMLTREQVARATAEASTAKVQLLYQMVDAVARNIPLEEVYAIALRNLTWAVGAARAAILLFDEDGVLRFKAWQGLSDTYRAAVEDSPWPREATVVQPIVVPDVTAHPDLARFRTVLLAEGIRALTVIPLIGHGRLLGKFMVYHDATRPLDQDGVQIAQTIARHVAFSIERTRGDEERRALLAREREARREAETANRAKDDFLAVLSHELRSPLNAIIGWLSILRRTPADAPTTERALEVIDRNARVQVQLIDDLLDVSRIISGRLKIERAPVDFVVLTTRAVDGFSAEAASRNLKVRTTAKAALLPVLGDRVRLHQVVSNLVANSLKFTPPGGRIEVRVEQANDKARLIVEDTGEGIGAEELPHVFERFTQADSSTVRHHGGLGLGLTLVRYLVEAHQGRVTAESAGKGQGARFTVDLPLTTAPLPRHARPVPASTPRPGPPVLAGIRAVVVEDDPDSRQYMEVVLAQAGAEVRATASGEQALAVLKREPIDILVADIGMPGLDGHAVVRRLRELEAAAGRKAIPAVAVSAYAAAEDRHRALAAGYHGHVAKPVEPTTLVRAVAVALGRSEPARVGTH